MTMMQRRTFLQVAGYAAVYGGLLADLGRRALALEPAEVAGSDPALHLLRRTSFGPTPEALARVRQVGAAAYLEEQLAASDGQTETMVQALYPLTNTSGTLTYATTGAGFAIDNHIRDLQGAALYRAAFSTAQLKEVMVDFWNDHFNTFVRRNPIPLKLDFDRLIRAQALGNFRTLFKATVKSGEMLHYLDNWLNRKDAINENYARELLELHSVGKGNYAEADMKALARILSGLGYVSNPVDGLLGAMSLNYGQVLFTDAQHDDGEKRFLGQVFPTGGGEAEIDRALELILDQPATARFVATKLCRRFVADEPPEGVVAAVAASFISSRGDIKAMLRTLFGSAEFAASAGAKRKRPMEVVIGALRACGVTPTERLLNFNLFGPPGNPVGLVPDALQRAGHLPYNWVPPNGYPDLQRYWANTNTSLYQQQFLVGFVEAISFGYVMADPVNALQFGNSAATAVARARTPRKAVDNVVARLLLDALPADARALLLSFVAQDADPDAEMDGAALELRVKGMVFVLLASPWFLLR